MWGSELHSMFEMWAEMAFEILEEQFFVIVAEIADNEPQYSVARFAAFPCLFLPHEVFCDDSYIPLLICCRQLLIGHVTVALHVVVSDVQIRTFISIEIHLPLVYPLNKFTVISCCSVMPSEFLALWQSVVSFANLDILLKILVYIRNSIGPNTLPYGTPDVICSKLQ